MTKKQVAEVVVAIMKEKEVKEKIGYLADLVTRHKDGSYTARRGFYYKFDKTALDFKNDIEALGIPVRAYGTEEKPFKGGMGVKANSHWWATFRA